MTRFRASRRDPNEAIITAALRAAGCVVVKLEPNDRAGVPDLCVGKAGRWYLMEVKSPAGPRGGDSGKGQRLNKAQDEFVYQAELRGLRVHVVHSVEEALAAIGIVDRSVIERRL
jgi:hypothetical protein